MKQMRIGMKGINVRRLEVTGRDTVPVRDNADGAIPGLFGLHQVNHRL